MTIITEKIVAKAGLNRHEAMVIRVHANLESAGKENSRTRRFVQELSSDKQFSLLMSAQEKIDKFLSGAGK